MHEPGPRGYQIGCTTMANSDRLQTGIPELDERLGGGLLRGTLTVVMGATGIGKTQLGLRITVACRKANVGSCST